MLIFKLLLTPFLIGLISLADRRWGSRVGGLLVGLPLTSAPVTLFVALELGTPFASHMATGILMGLISQAVFCLTYAWLSFRLNWLGSWLVGWGLFGISTFVFQHVLLPLPLILFAVLSAFILVLLVWPRSNLQGVATRAPAWALWGRMVVATSFVLFLTSTAGLLGPQLSGLLSPLPIYSTVFAIFAHKLQGGVYARQILHGVIVSSFACAAFFVIVAVGIENWGILVTYCTATLCALFTQGVMVWLLKRRVISNQQRVNLNVDTHELKTL